MKQPIRNWLVPGALVAALVLTAAGCGGAGQAPAGPAEETAADTPETSAPVEQAAETERAPAPARPAPVKQQRPVESAPASPPSEPAPPPPPPEPVVMTVPAGTVLEVAFLDGLSSKGSQVGDSFQARVTQDVMLEGIPVIPAGSVVVGTVTEAVPLKKIGGQAKLALEFSKLELTSGRSALIEATFAEQGKSETKKDAATIGGATAGGALLGRMINRKDEAKGTLIGAIVGAAAGSAIAAKTEGQEVEIPAGLVIGIELTQPAQITVEP